MKRSLPLSPDGWSSDGHGSQRAIPDLCPDCSHPLEIHQPGLGLPTRLLGICVLCRAWLLIDINDQGRTKTTRLPRPPAL
jgi:hypothetical protein